MGVYFRYYASSLSMAGHDVKEISFLGCVRVES